MSDSTSKERIHTHSEPTIPGMDSFIHTIGSSELYPLEYDELIAVKRRVNEFIIRNNAIAELFSCQEYKDSTEAQKQMRGNCVIGVVDCIDGRLPSILIGGRAMVFWREMAGIPITKKSPMNPGTNILAADRLATSIEAHAKKGTSLLQVLLAHTSMHDPDHGCGAMRLMEYPKGTDRVAENLNLLEEKADVITLTYNTAAKSASQQTLDTVAVTAVFDTDSFGMIFGYGTQNQIETKNITAQMARLLTENNLTHGQFSSLFEHNGPNFDPDMILQFESSVAQSSSYLLNENSFIDECNNIISTFPQLTPNQQQALRYMIARTVSVQYLSGLYDNNSGFYDNEGCPNHRFSDHGEDVISLSYRGAKVGDFDPQVQIFAASLANTQEAVKHITTACSLMDNNGADPPHLVFFSQPYNTTKAQDDTKNRVQAEVRGSIANLLCRKEIISLIGDRKLVLIPVIIDDSTRKVVEVYDFYA